MSMMKILVIDDEPLARERLKQIITELALGECVAEGSNGEQAVVMSQQHAPDVVLLDIRMPGMDGIEAAQHIMKLDEPPAIIFTTAYDEYALSAFDTHAVDYLLKPIRKERLQDALESAKRLTKAQLEKLNLADQATQRRQHISARLGDELRLIDVNDILYLFAEHKYVTVRYTQGTVLIEESLRSLEEEFDDVFLRVHRNALVARKSIAALDKLKDGGHKVKLLGVEDTLEVSRRHLPTVRKIMKSM
ncbi:Two-component transcriptional response regulator, LuxR family [hydrothermal vent metagenome]|uniref:Two-component transcriptional response regulator, LuxR family n=1 Tax=hydrothermal vent metagenome TaxID=652676 RepID=A0A3B1A1T4_9ZZZZ